MCCCVRCVICDLILFCFKQKTAYEMRISDWSSDVCSSDLRRAADDETVGQPRAHRLGDVGHRLEIGDAAVIDPVPNLLGAQLRRLCVEPGLDEQDRKSVV